MQLNFFTMYTIHVIWGTGMLLAGAVDLMDRYFKPCTCSIFFFKIKFEYL